jgi:hypothetical protein
MRGRALPPLPELRPALPLPWPQLVGEDEADEPEVVGRQVKAAAAYR